jgi:hypothetical protein
MNCKKCNYAIVNNVKVEYRVTGILTDIDTMLSCRDDGSDKNWETEWLNDVRSYDEDDADVTYKIQCPNCGENLDMSVTEFVEKLAKDGTITRIIDEDGDDTGTYELAAEVDEEFNTKKRDEPIRKIPQKEEKFIPVVLPIRPQDFEF